MSVLMVIQIWCHEKYNKYLCHVIKSFDNIVTINPSRNI